MASWLGAENFARLLKYCGVADKHDLAPLWSTWAKAPAKDWLTIFKGKVANEFFALGAIYEQFTPSLFMLTQITLLKWGMLNPDALESGSLGNAFLFTDQMWNWPKASIGRSTSSNREAPPHRMLTRKCSSRPRSTCRVWTPLSIASFECSLSIVPSSRKGTG